MIEVHVVKDKQRAEDITRSCAFPADSIVLAASENGDEVGFVALRMRYSPEAAAVDINGMSCPDADFGEMLVRAAVSYGERRGAENAYAIPDAYGAADGSDCRYTAMLRAGLRLNDGVMSVPVGNVVHMCKNCADQPK